MALIFIFGFITYTMHIQFAFQTVIGGILRQLVLRFIVAAHFYGLITEPTRWRNLLASKTFQILGWSSYTFYLIHYGPIADYYLEFGPHAGGFSGLFIFINIASIIIYYLIEKPCQSLIRKLLKQYFMKKADLVTK